MICTNLDSHFPNTGLRYILFCLATVLHSLVLSCNHQPTTEAEFWEISKSNHPSLVSIHRTDLFCSKQQQMASHLSLITIMIQEFVFKGHAANLSPKWQYHINLNPEISDYWNFNGLEYQLLEDQVYLRQLLVLICISKLPKPVWTEGKK